MQRLLLIIALPCLLLALVVFSSSLPSDYSKGAGSTTDGHQSSPGGPSADRGSDDRPSDGRGSDGLASEGRRTDGPETSARPRGPQGAAGAGTQGLDPTAGGEATAREDDDASSAAGQAASRSPRLEDLAPEVRAQVLELKRRGADPRLKTASDGSTFLELGGPAHFVPVGVIDEDGELTITEY